MNEISVISIIATAILALGCLYLILAPLFSWKTILTEKSSSNRAPSEKAILLTTLNEIEFEHNMGKLSEKDYVELKNQYETKVAKAMKTETALEEAPADPDLLEEVEREIQEAMLQYKKTKGES